MEQNTPPVQTSEPVASQQPQQSGWKKYLTVKNAIIVFCILLVLSLVYYFKSLVIAASVNGDAISRMEVIKRLEETAGGQVLDSLIANSLIASETKKQNISVSDEEVDAEIKKLESQFSLQGSTLEAALVSSNMKLEDLREQIVVQKEVEKLLGDKVAVTDAEVTAYITDNKIAIPAGEEAAAKAQLTEQLKAQKLNVEIENLISQLKANANIKYYVNY